MSIAQINNALFFIPQTYEQNVNFVCNNVMTVTELYKKIQQFKPKQEALKAIDRTKDIAVDYNRDQLYLHSQRSDGSYLQRYKDLEFYATYKHQINPTPGFGSPDLFLTGNFQNRMYAIIKGDFLHIDSKDEKTKSLVSTYGSHIFGLTKENVNKYATVEVRNEILNSLVRQTGLKAT